MIIGPKWLSGNIEDGKGGGLRAGRGRSFKEWVGPFFGLSMAKDLAL